MSLSVEDIVKEALSKGASFEATKKNVAASEATKLAHELEALANESEKEAEAFAELENSRESKKDQIKDFVDCVAEVLK